MQEFSFRTRKITLQKLREESFDFLIIGGGITGAATARDAASRGLKVALVEARDFAWGTSSRSSKLIHGGLRYLQNREIGLVFEALSERAHLLKSVPHMVHPLLFFMPVYKGDSPGRMIISMGLWFYDFLSLFRTPGFHRWFSKQKLIKKIPFLKEEGLLGGFRYYDASMWDDSLTIEILRDAHRRGASLVNYTEAISPLWCENKKRITGFHVRDLLAESPDQEPIIIKAKRVIACAGPWTDQLGERIDAHWKHWLKPSKGVHLVFDLKKIPVPGAVVMMNPQDGRISFVIPRPDYGSGVVIVGTTDGPTPAEPEKASVVPSDVYYLMNLLKRYFPSLSLSVSDILSSYVGVRPLMKKQTTDNQSENLQKISREHSIGLGSGGVVLVAGGKYTTHRLMAKEVVDFTLHQWGHDVEKGFLDSMPPLSPSLTDAPVNPMATPEALKNTLKKANEKGWDIPPQILNRYMGESLEIKKIEEEYKEKDYVEGFPYLEAQLRYAIRYEMVLHLEDFFLRRIPLFTTRKDHGLPWAEKLSKIWAEERGLSKKEAQEEKQRLEEEFARRDQWRQKLGRQDLELKEFEKR